jgi:hypothetical protein
MRRFLTIACLAAAAAVAAPLALAGNGKPAVHAACRPVSLAGTVASLARGSFALDLRRAGRVAVAVSAQTRVQVGLRRGSLTDLAAGQPVFVVARSCPGVVSARLVLARLDPAKVPIATGDSDLDGGTVAHAPAPTPAPSTPASPDEGSLDG